MVFDQNAMSLLLPEINYKVAKKTNIRKTNFVKERSEKKYGAHTHAHHLSATSSSQYSRQLLSILAQTQFEHH